MVEKKIVTPEDIDKFMNGRDPMERIVNLEYSYRDDFIRVYYRDENDNKHIKQEGFYPFLWATKKACRALCDGKKSEIRRYLLEYGISCTGLDTTNTKGEVVEEMENGYTVMFRAMKPMSYSRFLDFFKRCGNPVYADKKKKSSPDSFMNQTPEEKERSRQYLVVTPKEQYLISTGKRFFKGYDDYNCCLRMIFDLETTGLDTRKDRIEQFGIWFNRPVKYKGKDMEFHKIYDVSGNTKKELDDSELKNIRNFLKIIYTFRPDIITAHNGESFDWNIIIGACERLGTSLENESRPYFDGETIHKDQKETILKLGGEIEKFNKTIVPGCIVTDSLHAVRRAQAIDSNMQEANLKYVTKYSKMEKPDRVYVPGDKISTIYNDYKEHYAFNDEDGDWYIYNPDYEAANISDKRGKDTLPFTLYTKNKLNDGYRLVTGHYIVQRYLLDDLWECDAVEHRYNQSNFLICKMLPIPYDKCCTMGTAGQWKSLLMAWSYGRNLAIPMFGINKQFTGGLSRLIKTGYVDRVAKFDYNSLYPSIMLTWGITDENDTEHSVLSFLNYVLTQREKYKRLKKEAGKKANKIKEQLKNRSYSTREEGKALNAQMMKEKEYESANDKLQLPFKILGNSSFGSLGSPAVFPWGSLNCAERITCTGRQCLRLMISHFSTLGDINGLGKDYNYAPIVGDTDGFNFQLPKNYRYTKDNPYVSPGLSRETKAGKSYVDFEADVAEFNDVYMRDKHYNSLSINKMGLGIDEIVDATINFARKNYADYFPENPYPEDVKLVGNTIKSKKLPEYIKKFLDKAVRMLLQNRGKDFIEEYYSYIEKIYNYQIPLRQIASKGKVKKTLKEYSEDCKTITKAGQPKPRQSWMELALRNNLDVHLGETLYYINTGTAKSHADVKKVTHYYRVENDLIGEVKKDCKAMLEKEYKKAPDGKATGMSCRDWVEKKYPDIIIEDEIILNCELVPQHIIDAEQEYYCEDGKEYNVPKYIDQFNKRITPLLVCFSRDIRNQILVTNPKDRGYFTEEQCQLVSGEPNKPGDQDTYEALMTMDDREIRFWMAHPEWEIPFLKECGMDWDAIVKDYNERMEREKELGINKIREIFDKALDSLSNDDYTAIIEENTLPLSMAKIVAIDQNNGNIVAKDYTDVKISSISEIIDYRYQKTLIGNSVEEDNQGVEE